MHESKMTLEQASPIKISMYLVHVVLNATIKWAGPYIKSCRSMETPPEPEVLFENIVNHSTSQFQGPTVLCAFLSVLQERGNSSPQHELCEGGYSPCPLLLKQGHLHSRVLCFPFVQTLQKLRYTLCSAALGWNKDRERLAL